MPISCAALATWAYPLASMVIRTDVLGIRVNGKAPLAQPMPISHSLSRDAGV
jgi:hypothetical protein